MTLVKWKRPSSNGQLSKQLIYKSPFQDLFQDIFPEGIIGSGPYFTPAANVLDEEKEYSIELAVPGFEKSDFRVELKDKVLNISGEHKNETESSDNIMQRREFSRHSFRRDFTLPDHIREEEISARYENGILKVSIPKDDMNTAKTIAVS